MMLTSLIISLDGNVNAGKTTALKNWVDSSSQNRRQYVEEHADFINHIHETYADQVNNHQDPYIIAEYMRSKIIRQVPEKIVYLDRSVISVLAHTLVTTHPQEKQRLYVIDAVINGIQKRKIFLPDHFMFLYTDYSVCLARFNDNKYIKGTNPLYIEESYFSAVWDTYNLFCKALNGIVCSEESLEDAFSMREILPPVYSSDDFFGMLDLVKDINFNDQHEVNSQL